MENGELVNGGGLMVHWLKWNDAIAGNGPNASG